MTTKQQTIAGVAELPPWLNISTWEAFLVQRTKKKAANTTYALGLILRKLDGFRSMGHDPNSVLDYSIEFGYTGVFEPKGPLRVVTRQQERSAVVAEWTGRSRRVG